MLKFLLKLFLAWGKTGDDYDRSHSDYVPRYSGQWVNKGKGYDEKWEWVEKVVNLRPYWINVFRSGKSGYMIIVALEPSQFAIEHLDCNGLKEMEAGVSLLNSYYSVLGPVTIDTSLTSEVHQS